MDVDYFVVVVGEFDVGIVDEEWVDCVGGVVDCVQGEVVDGDVGIVGKFVVVVVLV